MTFFRVSPNPGAGEQHDVALAAVHCGIEGLWARPDRSTAAAEFLMARSHALATLLVYGGVIELDRQIFQKHWEETCSKVEGIGPEGWRFFLLTIYDFLATREKKRFMQENAWQKS